MAYQPFYMQGFETGLERDKPDFLLMNDGLSLIQDAYVWRNRIIRKAGYESLRRLLRILSGESLGNTSGSPHTGNIKTTLSLETNAEIAQGSVEITVAAPNTETFTEPSTPDGTLVGSGGGTGSINYVTGAYSITSGAGWGAGQAITIDFEYYPGLPCMGIGLRELVGLNAEQTVAFDTKYAYGWNTTNERFQELNSGTTWQGNNSQFFYISNYYSNTASGNIMFATNFNAGATPDPIRYFDAATLNWNTFNPAVDGSGNELHQAKIILPYKGRLLAFNTWEGGTLATSTQNPRRVRWSQNGDPLAADAWRSDIAGKGGFINAPTSEHIVSAQFVKNVLVVGFERSTWKLRYTENPALPFVWEQVDNEFGIESQYSVVRSDNTQVGIGQRGIIACDGLNATRIDEKIPDEVFKIHNENNGIERVHGIRDYDKELIYWCLPSSELNRTYPNRVLVFNYKNMTWSFFKDSFTTFGVLQEFDDRTFADYPDTTMEMATFPWTDASLQSLYPDIIAGNQHGYIVKLQKFARNDPAFAITDITPGTPVQLEIPDHNLETGDYISIKGILGTSSTLNNDTYRINYVNDDNITLSDENGIPVTVAAGSTYLGGGEVIQLHNYRVKTKKFNLLDQGSASELGYIDFVLGKTTNGEFSVDLYQDHDESNPINLDDTFFNNTVLTYPYENEINNQDKLVHRFYCRSHLEFFQFELNLDNLQKADDEIHNSDIVLYSMIIWSSKGGRLVE